MSLTSIGQIKTLPPIVDRFRSQQSKKIVFVDCGGMGKSIYGSATNLAIQILGNIATNKGFNYESFQLDIRTNEEVVSTLKKGDILAISSTSPSHKKAIELADLVKLRFGDKVLIIKGGIHETFVGQRYQGNDNYPIDLSFIGEAEKSFPQFLDVLNNLDDGISGIAYRGMPELDFKPIRLEPNEQILPELKHLELIEPFTIFKGKKDGELMLRVQDTRGCPESCTFCAIQNLTARQNAKKIVNYIGDVIREAYGKDIKIPYVFFETGTFLLDEKFDNVIHYQDDKGEKVGFKSREWLETFCKEFKALNQSLEAECGFKVGFATQTTTKSLLNKEVVSMLKDAGLCSAYVGVESFDEKKLREMAVSKTNKVECLEALDILKKFSINATCSTIVEPGYEQLAIDTISKLMDEGIHEIFIEYRAVYPNTGDANRVSELQGGLSVALSRDEILDRYSSGQLITESMCGEDVGKIIVKSYGKRILVVPQEEYLESSRTFYTRLNELATNKGYSVPSHGHYINN